MAFAELALNKHFPFGRVQRSQVNRPSQTWTRRDRAVEKVPPVGQEARPDMAKLSLTEHRSGRGHAPRRGHFLERRSIGRSKDNHSISIPRSAAIVRRVAQRNWRTAGHVNFFELSAREESERAAVGRPERRRGALRSGKRLRGERVERADPEKSFAFRAHCNECDLLAIGRNRHRSRRSRGHCASSGQAPLVRREKGKADSMRLLRSAPEISERSKSQRRKEKNGCDDPGETRIAQRTLAAGGDGRRQFQLASRLRQSTSTRRTHRWPLCHLFSGSLARHFFTTRSSAGGVIG